MAKWIKLVTAMMGLGALAVPSHAALLEQVNLDGSAGHSTIQSAVNAVSDGGVIEIIEAGTYQGSVLLPGSKSFTIRATVPGVVSENIPGSGLYSVPNASTVLTPPLDLLFIDGKVDVTFEDFTIRRVDGTGPAFDVDQRLKQPNPVDDYTVTLTFDNMIVEHSLAGAGGEALKIDDGPAGVTGNGATLTINAVDTIFRTVSNSGTSKSALRVQSDASDVIDNLNVNLTNVLVEGVNEGVIRNDGRNNQNWTLTNVTINAPGDRAFEMDDPHSGCTFTFTNVTINAEEECILANDPGEDNTWILNRCTFNNAFGTLGDIAVNIRYPDNVSDPVFGGILTPSSDIQMYNCLILSQEGSGGNFRGFNQQDNIATLYNNTFIAAGTGGEKAMGNSNGAGASGTVTVARNNLMLNYADAGVVDPLLRQVMSGSYAGSGYNIIVGPVDDDSKGATGLWVDTPAGLAGCITAAGINATTYVPEAGSVTLGASDPDPAIVTAIGGVDRLGVTRPGPTGSIIDVGAFENATLPVVISTIPGDVNDDGFVDVADVTELGNYINAIVGLPAGDADVDNIGGVGDAADLDYLVDFLVGDGPAPPAP